MLGRRAPEPPQRVLQPPGERHPALPAQHHLDVAPARVGERKLIEPVRERRPGDAHPQLVRIGEVGQPQAPRGVLLGEEDFAVLAFQRAPPAHPPLQRAQHPRLEPPGIAPLQFLEQRHRRQRRRLAQQRHQLRLPHPGQRVSPRAPPAQATLRRQCRRLLDTTGAANADPHLRRRRILPELPAQLLVSVHLMIRNALAGHRASSSFLFEESL